MARAPLHSREGVFPLLRIGGISVVADASWLLQVLLLTVVSRAVLVRAVLDEPSTALGWAVALGFALAIVACIVVHELAHSFVARLYRMPVRRIVLFLFGGVSQIEREAPTPRAEFAIAIAGPMASIVLAAMLAGVARMQHPTSVDIPGVWGWFGVINWWLAMFNLLPAFPMDGGRLLRSLMWAGARDRRRATHWAALAGKGFATAMFGFGAVIAILPLAQGTASDGEGLWLILLGVFLFQAAGSAERLEGGERPNERSTSEDGP